MYPKQQVRIYNYSLDTMNKDDNVERKETMMRIDDRGRGDEDEEDKKIDTFFKLIKNYQEARKRRREELAENSSGVMKKSNGGERSRIVVPAFQPEDFSQCRTDLKPLMTVSDHKEEDTKVKQEDEAEAEKLKQDKALDLNLTL
ncbi:PREDICTED: protein NIM1-INTERACTING 1-like [Camelina sativa]|uniref:Protein NIM1-INTERACTING 1-like n=1 Tax=Camelina sativa TaxID=90675 RepID=A0ABM0X5D8_CAMSA|nr:PREDICTED: protein NIM1-INTERACTING 1-like [Camelina sativa]